EVKKELDNYEVWRLILTRYDISENKLLSMILKRTNFPTKGSVSNFYKDTRASLEILLKHDLLNLDNIEAFRPKHPLIKPFSNKSHNAERAVAINRRLEEDEESTVKIIVPKKQKIMLDSGAFSAWTKGLQIDLKEYCDFIFKFNEYLDTYINLDVIPGIPNKKRTREEVESSAELSYKNLIEMKKLGLSPIPVYHWGEDMSWLERLLNDGEKYIAIGVPGVNRETLVSWLDRVFTVLTRISGEVKVKVHGLGVFKPFLMERYPWYSVDATSWIMQAASGRILIPPRINGKARYDKPPIQVYISGQGSSLGALDIQSLGPILKDAVFKFLDEVGVDYVSAVAHHHPRMKVCAYYFKQLGEKLDYRRPFKHRVRGIGFL
ncbi:MAG TPA: hypothetical protein VFV16_07750, partial [Candidatus Nitrosotalea sp.]|nr:hypothetical protein [Candidatus Nitrosotalea sp.]